MQERRELTGSGRDVIDSGRGEGIINIKIDERRRGEKDGGREIDNVFRDVVNIHHRIKKSGYDEFITRNINPKMTIIVQKTFGFSFRSRGR